MTPHLRLHEHIEAQVDRTPQWTAAQYENAQLTYAQLDTRANQLARLLRSFGTGPEQVVGVALPRGLDLVVTLLAVLKAGGAFLPLDPDQPPARIELMLTDARARVVVTDSTLVTAELMDTLVAAGERLVCVRRDAAEIGAMPARRLAVPTHERNLAYVIYTSGSTGRPKAAMNEHRAVVNRLLWMQLAFGLVSGEGVLQKTPVGFDVSIWEFFWPLMVGARCVLARRGGHIDPGYLAEVIDATDITTVHFVPSMLATYLADRTFDHRRPTLRTIVCSGEELPAALLATCARLLPDTAVFNLYGPAEAAIDVTWHPCAAHAGAWVPIGQPIDGARVHVTDRAVDLVPIGSPGELLLGGIPVGRGYWQRPGLTADRFIPDPYGEPGARLYRTGDAVRTHHDGAIQFLGRLDNQVKLRGMRIEPGEIESALAGHPAVDSAAVGLRTYPDNSPALVGWIRLVDDPTGDLGQLGRALTPQLRAYLRTQLPAHMVPSRFVVVRRWPVNQNGKLDRRALSIDGSPAGPV